MSTMSGEMRRRPPAAILLGRLAAIATLVCFVSGSAVAQTPPTAPQTMPAPQAAPSLESGDTAPPPGAPPTAVPPLPAPSPVPAQTAVVEPLYTPPPPEPQQLPLYRRNWFWGAIGVVLVTGVVLLFVSLSNADPPTPGTRLGDMRAF
jgi:hypothetical protein